MSFGEIVCFTDDELTEIQQIAEDRNKPKEGKIKSQKVNDSQSELGVNVLGARGEYAVAKILDLSVAESFGKRGDVGFDFIAHDYTIDVKFNKHEGGDLYFGNLSKFIAQCAVLVVSYQSSECVRVVGVISREQFVEKCHEVDYGYGVNLAVKQYELSPISMLVDFIQLLKEKG